MQIVCKTCGLVPCAWFDGYPFGDTLLEDVYFKVKFAHNGNAVVESLDDWKENAYLKGLDEEYWLEQAQDYAESTDVFECPSCHDDIGSPLFDEEMGDKTQISVITGYDLLSKLAQEDNE